MREAFHWFNKTKMLFSKSIKTTHCKYRKIDSLYNINTIGNFNFIIPNKGCVKNNNNYLKIILHSVSLQAINSSYKLYVPCNYQNKKL
jgi:hypothetical protein